MNAFELNEELEGLEILSNELKEKVGFGKNGEKNFDGVLTELQMQSYWSDWGRVWQNSWAFKKNSSLEKGENIKKIKVIFRVNGSKKELPVLLIPQQKKRECWLL